MSLNTQADSKPQKKKTGTPVAAASLLQQAKEEVLIFLDLLIYSYKSTNTDAEVAGIYIYIYKYIYYIYIGSAAAGSDPGDGGVSS
jgi:hypothetical protein